MKEGREGMREGWENGNIEKVDGRRMREAKGMK